MSFDPYQAPEVLSQSNSDLVLATRPGLAFFVSMICGSVIAFALPASFLLVTGELVLLKRILAVFTDLSSKFYRFSWAWILVPGLVTGLGSFQTAKGRSARHVAAASGLFQIAFILLCALVLGPGESWLYRCAIAAGLVQIFLAVTIGRACCASTHQSS